MVVIQLPLERMLEEVVKMQKLSAEMMESAMKMGGLSQMKVKEVDDDDIKTSVIKED